MIIEGKKGVIVKAEEIEAELHFVDLTDPTKTQLIPKPYGFEKMGELQLPFLQLLFYLNNMYMFFPCGRTAHH